MSRPASTSTTVSWVVFGVGAAVFITLAVIFVPWRPYPGGALELPEASSVFSADHLDRAREYASGARWLGRSALVVSLVVACVLGFTRVGRQITRRLRGPWPLQVAEAVLIVLLIGQIAVLPFAVPRHQRAVDAGLSVQPWSAWIGDQVLSLGVSTVIATLAIVVLLACTRRWPRAWPAVTGAIVAALVVLGSFVYPLLVQPLFNDFHSLEDGPLRTQVLQVADEEGVDVDDVLVADASKRTTTLNAYVSGFGSTRRVVLYDTLVNNVPADEALSVVAHELAHAKHDDVLLGTALGASGAFAAVGLLGLVVGRRRDLTTAAAVPMILAVYAIGGVVATPIENTISRQIEIRADVDALRTTQDRDAFVAVQRELALHSLSDPEPAAWSQFWFGSHPTVLQRMALADRILD